jgi:SAM-dependent methyltransferase
MTRRREKIRSHYEPRIKGRRPSHEVLDWASAASQEARFRVLVENVPLAGKSLLDVGCGLGDLFAYLKRRGIVVEYTGVDLLEKMVDAARKRNPDAHFIQADVFTEETFLPGQFDVVFVSGAFNLNLGNNLDFLAGAVRLLLDVSRECAVFNLLHKRAPHDDDRYFYCEPAEVLEILAPLHCRPRIIDDYLPNDFTVICRKLTEKQGPGIRD